MKVGASVLKVKKVGASVLTGMGTGSPPYSSQPGPDCPNSQPWLGAQFGPFCPGPHSGVTGAQPGPVCPGPQLGTGWIGVQLGPEVPGPQEGLGWFCEADWDESLGGVLIGSPRALDSS